MTPHPSATPTLGYQTRWQAAAALRDRGLHPAEIARQMGVNERTARWHLYYAGLKETGGDDARPVKVPKATLEGLREAAARRNVAVDTLVRRLLVAIEEGGIVGAVLDDGEGA